LKIVERLRQARLKRRAIGDGVQRRFDELEIEAPVQRVLVRDEPARGQQEREILGVERACRGDVFEVQKR
jgi:hypothetical protein